MNAFQLLTIIICLLVWFGQAFPQYQPPPSNQERVLKTLKGIEEQLEEMNRIKRMEQIRQGREKSAEMREKMRKEQEEEDKRKGITRDSMGLIKSIRTPKKPPPPSWWEFWK